jgi:hypothetical protein
MTPTISALVERSGPPVPAPSANEAGSGGPATVTVGTIDSRRSERRANEGGNPS